MTAPDQGIPSDPFGQFQYPTVPLLIIRQFAHAAAQATADLLLPQMNLRIPLDGAWEA